MSKEDERRDFFRVYQDVIFDYKSITEELANTGTPDQPFNAGVSMHLASELKRLDREGQPALKLIGEKNRTLGDALKRINAKVDLVVRHQIFANMAENKSPSRINLSEEGVAFKAEEGLSKGDYVAMQIIFIPSYITVLVFGRIVRSETTDDGCKAAAKFHNLQELDRKELARQILKVQTQKRQQQKQAAQSAVESGD